MSWKDNYTRDLIITCGDGESFTCYTLPSFIKEIEFNVTEFNFIDIDHPLIKKTTISGTDIPLEFFFINEDHLNQTKSFLFSAADPNPWTISHPYYETLLVQVSRIKVDDSDGNITKINCNARVTISDGEVFRQNSAIQTVTLMQQQVLAQIEPPLELNPTVTDINTVKSVTTKNYKNSIKIITNAFDSEDYFNAFNTALSYVNTITDTPLAAIESLKSIISLPAQFAAAVVDRVRVLIDAMVSLRDTIFGLSTVTAKDLFFIQGTVIISSLCQASVQPVTGDYDNPNVAGTIAGQISQTYATFQEDIDAMQGDNGSNPLSFFPEFNTSFALGELVNVTVSNLFSIALNGRKEFEYVLPENSDYLLLTHKFYGLDSQDSNINQFLYSNGIGYKEIVLGSPKGKTIYYYA